MAKRRGVDTDTLFSVLEETRAEQNAADAELIRQLRNLLGSWVSYAESMVKAGVVASPSLLLGRSRELLGTVAGEREPFAPTADEEAIIKAGGVPAFGWADGQDTCALEGSETDVVGGL